MSALAFLLCVALPAHADLYRWVDPDSGSVKLSTLPPSDQRVNAELARHLDEGARRVRLTGVEGQRLMAAGLAGPWDAVVELEGRAGPELAAAMDAPGLTVVCHEADQGSAHRPHDIAGRGLAEGEGWRQQMETYEAVRAELDRLDPAGAVRRRSESSNILDRLRQGFGQQK